jgi:hypothetical protein
VLFRPEFPHLGKKKLHVHVVFPLHGNFPISIYPRSFGSYPLQVWFTSEINITNVAEALITLLDCSVLCVHGRWQNVMWACSMRCWIGIHSASQKSSGMYSAYWRGQRELTAVGTTCNLESCSG